MASITRQDIFGRFKEVSLESCPIKEQFRSFPCITESSSAPEPEDATVDFELILKQLDDQSQMTKEYHDKKVKEKRNFHKKFVKNKEQIVKHVEDEEHFKVVTNDQRKKFFNKKKGKHHKPELNKKKSNNPKDADAEKPKKKQRTARAEPKKKEDEGEAQPFPDFLGLQENEEIKVAKPEQPTAKHAPASQETSATAEPAKHLEEKKAPNKKVAKPKAAPKPAEPAEIAPSPDQEWNLEAIMGVGGATAEEAPKQKKQMKASDKLRNRAKQNKEKSAAHPAQTETVKAPVESPPVSHPAPVQEEKKAPAEPVATEAPTHTEAKAKAAKPKAKKAPKKKAPAKPAAGEGNEGGWGDANSLEAMMGLK